MNYGEVQTTPCPIIHDLPSQDPRQSVPYPPHLLEVDNDFRIVIFRLYEEAPQIFEGRHCLQWLTILLEHHRFTCPCFLLHQPPPFPVCALCVEGGGGVEAVESRSWQKCVVIKADGVEAVPFLHNHCLFLHVAVHEVNTEVGTNSQPLLIDLF